MSEISKPKTPFGVYVKRLILGLVILIILGFLVFKLGSFASSISKNWKEIQFAISKPSIVQSIRQDYEARQEKMDQSFLQKEKSSEQQLIDEVVKKLQSDNLK